MILVVLCLFVKNFLKERNISFDLGESDGFTKGERVQFKQFFILNIKKDFQIYQLNPKCLVSL